MIIFKRASDISEYLSQQRRDGFNIGFVPTMGALHEGHISLVKRAKAAMDLTVCSIFLNPTQFNDKNDLEQYPVTIENDMDMLLEAECDVLFLPPINEVYPHGADRQKTYDFGRLEQILEGEKRPGHFKGVGQVVGRLFEIIQPQHVYMGQKDYQQCMVVTKLTELMGRKDVHIIVCPTIREADGLAMSSRNRRLTPLQRSRSGSIYQCLVSIQSKQFSGNFDIVKKECVELLAQRGFETEYIAIADSRNLNILHNFDPQKPMVALIAVKTGGIRLIDNILLN